MNIFRTLTEAPPSIRWHVGAALSAVLYRRAFRAFGSGSVIVRPLRLRGTARISVGSGCSIYEGAWLEAETGGQLLLGDDVYLGHNVHLHAVGDVAVGSGSMLTDGVLVSSGAHQMDNAKAAVAGKAIKIGRNCFLGERSIVLGGVTIGDGATIGAGSVVTRDVPAGAVAAGVPARILQGPETES